jgi:membrane-bound lytic murein transglycosylase F
MQVYRFLLPLALVLFSVCSGRFDQKQEYIAKIDLPQIQKRGYLTVSMDNNSTGYFLYRGKIMGFEYELLKRFADEQGLELRIDVTKSLEEAFNKLNRGETDILAYNLTVTKERQERFSFTTYHNLVRQVLVQRKPDGWEKMPPSAIDRELIRNPVDLINRTVWVRHHSAHKMRLENLSEEIGGPIDIIEDSSYLETEELIRKVAEGIIDYTVAEEDVAQVNAGYFPNLDVETAIGFPQQIAWGVRKTSDSLRNTLNEWLVSVKKRPLYQVLYNRYFKARHEMLHPDEEYVTYQGGRISPYDELIKEAANELGWDWRLVAALIYKESRFNPRATSWAGAEGLMQLMPNTARAHGIKDPMDPRQSIKAGTKHLKWLQDIWAEKIVDPVEQQKFILASYNIGQGHVIDAMNLAIKDGYSGQKWEGEVEEYLLKKSTPIYYRNPVVQHGYCRGIEAVDYVRRVYWIYDSYVALTN